MGIHCCNFGLPCNVIQMFPSSCCLFSPFGRHKLLSCTGLQQLEMGLYLLNMHREKVVRLWRCFKIESPAEKEKQWDSNTFDSEICLICITLGKTIETFLHLCLCFSSQANKCGPIGEGEIGNHRGETSTCRFSNVDIVLGNSTKLLWPFLYCFAEKTCEWLLRCFLQRQPQEQQCRPQFSYKYCEEMNETQTHVMLYVEVRISLWSCAYVDGNGERCWYLC